MATNERKLSRKARRVYRQIYEATCECYGIGNPSAKFLFKRLDDTSLHEEYGISFGNPDTDEDSLIYGELRVFLWEEMKKNGEW